MVSKIITIDEFDMNDFSENYYLSKRGYAVMYLKENMLDGFNLGYEKFSEEFSKLLEKKYDSFSKYIMTLMLTLTGIMIVFSLISFTCVLKIRGEIIGIYTGFMGMKEKQFKKKLENLDKILKNAKFEEGNIYKSVRSIGNFTTRSQIFVRKNVSKNKKFKRKYRRTKRRSFYCMNLQFPISVIFIFYSLLTAISFYTTNQFESKASSRVLLTQKIIDMNNLIQNQIGLITAIKQFIILGPDKNISGKNPLEYIKELNEKVELENREIRKISDFSTNPELNNAIYDFFSKIEKQSLCEFTPSLTNDLEFCTGMDNAIPAQGYTQSYFRISQFLRETVERIKPDKMMMNHMILHDDEFKIVEYMVLNVYYPAFFQITVEFMNILLTFIEETTDKAKLNAYLLMIGCLSFGWVFIILSFHKIRCKVDQAVFVFRCVDLDHIIGNSITRLKFFKIYGLRRNQKL